MSEDIKQNYSSRDSNFEALRISCMLFIIAGHMIMWHDMNNKSLQMVINCGIRPFFMVAVNCFVLISGWFAIKLHYAKLWKLNNVTTFWCILLAILAIVFGIHQLNPMKDVLMLFPVLTKRYWFITVYIALCLLSPFINRFVEVLNKEQFKSMLIILVVLFVLLPTLGAVFNFESITLDSGYGIMNFITLYLMGRYLRIYRIPRRSSLIYFGLYFLLMLLCGVFQIAFSRIMGFQFTTFFSYDTFFVFFGAIALFCAFSKLKFKNKLINIASSYCFAVYIIHIHPWTGKWIFEDLCHLKDVRDSLFILSLFIIPVLTYIVCGIMDLVRSVVFTHIRTFCCIFNKYRLKSR